MEQRLAFYAFWWVRNPPFSHPIPFEYSHIHSFHVRIYQDSPADLRIYTDKEGGPETSLTDLVLSYSKALRGCQIMIGGVFMFRSSLTNQIMKMSKKNSFAFGNCRSVIFFIFLRNQKYVLNGTFICVDLEN